MNRKTMKINEFENEVKSIAARLNWDEKNPWVSEHIIKSARMVKEIDNHNLSDSEKELLKELGRTYTFSEEIANVITNEDLSIVDKIKIVYKDNNTDEIEERELIAALISGKAKSTPDLYQVIIPALNKDGRTEYNARRTPYLMKDLNGNVYSSMTDRNLSMISNQSEETLFTKREIEYNHPHLSGFMYKAQTGHIKDKNWFEETVKILFSDSKTTTTDWATSEIINDINKNVILETPKEVYLSKDTPVKIHRYVAEEIVESFSTQYSSSAKMNRKDISLLEIIESLEENEWIKDFWLPRSKKIVDLLLALFTWNFEVEKVKYQFAIPELDKDENCICLVKKRFANGGPSAEYKAMSLSKFELKPEETMFTKEEFEENPQFSFLWSSRIEE